VLEGGETANLLRKFNNRVEGYIELHKAGHLADDIRHMHKLVVRDVQEFQELEAEKVPGQLLYPVVLEPGSRAPVCGRDQRRPGPRCDYTTGRVDVDW
jgi:hypothetical protein